MEQKVAFSEALPKPAMHTAGQTQGKQQQRVSHSLSAATRQQQHTHHAAAVHTYDRHNMHVSFTHPGLCNTAVPFRSYHLP
jgi:hypothetical protein